MNCPDCGARDLYEKPAEPDQNGRAYWCEHCFRAVGVLPDGTVLTQPPLHPLHRRFLQAMTLLGFPLRSWRKWRAERWRSSR